MRDETKRAEREAIGGFGERVQDPAVWAWGHLLPLGQ